MNPLLPESVDEKFIVLATGYVPSAKLTTILLVKVEAVKA